MANQLNNIMMAITGYAEVELKQASAKERRGLERILSNANRATLLIQRLLAFSRERTSPPEVLEVNCVIQEVGELMRQLAGQQIEVTFDLAPKLQRVKTDRMELERLLLSLAVRARKLMTAGGKLVVSTQLATLEQKFHRKNKYLPAGTYVLLTVCDKAADDRTITSIGDSPSHQTMASSVIVAEEGRLVGACDDPTDGASLSIYFPAIDHETKEPLQRNLSKEPSSPKTILVVEDDDAVRGPAAEFLMMEGFKVLQVRTGEEAMRVAQQIRSPLDLLITDIVMPGMNGREVAERLLEIYPQLSILYMSGDAQQEAATISCTTGLQHLVLQKPFRLNKLKESIHELLGE